MALMSSYNQRMAGEIARYLWRGFLNGIGYVVMVITVPLFIARVALFIIKARWTADK